MMENSRGNGLRAAHSLGQCASELGLLRHTQIHIFHVVLAYCIFNFDKKKKKDVITQKTSSSSETQTEPMQWETRVTTPSSALLPLAPLDGAQEL